MNSSSSKHAVHVAPETNYFSVDDILASQMTIPCKVELPIYRLGFLDPSSDDQHLLPGTMLELPLWLALTLCNSKRNIVSTDLPKYYRESHREILSAEASAVDLHTYGPYFYNVGQLLLRFEQTDHKALALMLQNVFINRYRMIMDRSQNSAGGNIVQLTQRLDEDEKGLFLAGFSDVENYLQWQSREGEKMRMPGMVSNQRKRKHAEMEANVGGSGNN